MYDVSERRLSTSLRKGTPKHPNSRKIRIIRKANFIENINQKKNNNSQGVKDFLDMSSKTIGSYFASKDAAVPGTGLTNKELDILMPRILMMDRTEKEYRPEVKYFFQKIQTKVPFHGGIELEIGLENSNDDEVSEDNLPIVIMDYIRYKHALKHPQVALTETLAKKSAMKEYYIYDRYAEDKEKAGKADQADEAMEVYLTVRKDAEKVSSMLTLLGQDPMKFSGVNAETNKAAALKEIATKRVAEFLEVYNLENFEARVTLQAMVNAGVLQSIGDRYLFPSGDTFANNLMEAIAIFNDPKESAKISALKAQLQDAQKAGISLEKGAKRTTTKKK